MKVLHLTSHLDVGGISRYTVSLAAELAQRGHRPIIGADGGELDAQVRSLGLPHWRVPLHTSAEFSPQVALAAWRLATHLEQEPVDLIHAHTRVAQVVAARLSRRLHTPYLTTWHGFFRSNLGRRLWPCTGLLTIAISEPVRQHLIRDFGVPEARIRLIPHGIDAALFASPVEPAVQQRLREQLQLSEGPVIGTVARLVKSKGVDQLLRSLPHIRAAAPTAQLLIVGDGEERAPLEQLAGELGVASAVRFSGTLTQTRAALSLMQVFVFLPAEEEGFGLALLEAMAAGRPIVAVRRGGGSTWLLDESRVAMAVEPGDVAGLAATVLRSLQDGEEAARASAAHAQALVRDRFSLSRMVDAVESVYQEVLRIASR